jgi:CelD/BcsL family acetyltransferase involved in cellulose biosynthesis
MAVGAGTQIVQGPDGWTSLAVACCSDVMTDGGGVDVLDVDHPDWTGFVARRPDATCFHQPAWASLIATCYRFRAFVVVHRDAAGGVVAGLPLVEVRRAGGPRRWICLPFTDECGPLAAAEGAVGALLREADDLRRRTGVADLLIRDGVPVPEFSARAVAVTHRLALRQPAEGGAPKPRSSVRRAIAAAERAGVRVRIGDRRSDLLDEYYRLHILTRRRQGVPVQPRRYFELLWTAMIEPGQGVVALAEQGGSVIAGAVFLTGGETVTYKYGASDERFWPVRPNHAVMSRAIAWAAGQGFTWFDLGRSDLDNPGLIRFKETWGATAVPLTYTSAEGDVDYGGSQRARALLAVVIRRSPPAACRAIGTMLYRFAA